MSGPPDRLPDADRQPRGRHAARARGAAGRRRGRLRGHAAHAHAARPLRRHRRAASPTTSTTSASARPSSSRGCRRGRSSRSSPTPACRWSPIPGFILVQACIAAGLSVEVLPGPSSALAALVASGLPGGSLALRRLPATGARASSSGCCSPRQETLVAFESPKRLVGDAGAARRRRPGAARRRVPRADQAARGGPRAGRRRRSPRTTGASRLAARSCSSSRPRRPAPQPDAQERAVEALRALVAAGARPRPAAKVLAELTGVPANRLYAALTER